MQPKRPLACYAVNWRRLQSDFDSARTLAHNDRHAAARELVDLEIQAGWLVVRMHAWEWPIPGCRPLGKNYYIGLLADRQESKTGDDPYGLGGVAALKWHFTCRMIREHGPEQIGTGLPEQSEQLDTWPACVLQSNVFGGDGHFHASRARAFSQACGIMAEECENFEVVTQASTSTPAKPVTPATQESESETVVAPLTANQSRVLVTMSRFDPVCLVSAATIAAEMEAAGRLSARTIGPIVRKLIEMHLAERPEGDRSGARLTTAGRRLASKIAD